MSLGVSLGYLPFIFPNTDSAFLWYGLDVNAERGGVVEDKEMTLSLKFVKCSIPPGPCKTRARSELR